MHGARKTQSTLPLFVQQTRVPLPVAILEEVRTLLVGMLLRTVAPGHEEKPRDEREDPADASGS